MKYILIVFLILLVFIISIMLGAHNDQVITFNYLLAQGSYQVSTLLGILFSTGFILGWTLCGLFYLRTRLLLARAQRKIKRLELQLAQPAEMPAPETVKE